ncbi:MAG: LPS assembly lipoprotein LptE [Syntrophorhabdaceae bacterium]|nr:LPS assembly lipoprotein LptE [Syntrophorhabdaceae bacterium]
MRKKIYPLLLPCTVILSMLLILPSCGYQLVREKGIFGGEISSISIGMFKNMTFDPHVSMYVTDAFTKEIVSSGLFKINQGGGDGYIEGSIRSIRIAPTSMNALGVIVEKNMTVVVDLALYRSNGNLIKRWAMTEMEVYRTDDVNAEDYNKRDAISRLSARMARKFVSILLIDY